MLMVVNFNFVLSNLYFTQVLHPSKQSLAQNQPPFSPYFCFIQNHFLSAFEAQFFPPLFCFLVIFIWDEAHFQFSDYSIISFIQRANLQAAFVFSVDIFLPFFCIHCKLLCVHYLSFCIIVLGHIFCVEFIFFPASDISCRVYFLFGYYFAHFLLL